MKRLLILLMMMMWVPNAVLANIYFPDTVAKTVIKSRYSKREVRGKQTLTFSSYDKQTYYIYVSAAESQDGVIVNFDSPLDYYIAPSEEHFYLYPNKENGGIHGKKTITIKAKKQIDTQTSTTIQFKTRNYFLNVELIFTPTKKHGNRFVYFQHPTKDNKKRVFDEKRFMDLEEEFAEKIAQRESLMSRILANHATYFPLNEKILIKNTLMILDNLAVVNDNYLLTVLFEGEDKIQLEKEDVKLNIQPFQYSLATEIKQTIESQSLVDVVNFKTENGQNGTTFIFEVPEPQQKKRFFLELYLTPFNVFRKKVNLDYHAASKEEYLFNVDIR